MIVFCASREALHKSTVCAFIEENISMIRKASFQRTLASQRSFEKHGRNSKRELFLDQMEEAVPWSELLALVSPHLSEGWERSSACRFAYYAADLIFATVVPPV